MALQLTFDDQYGSTHASAYHRVVLIKLDIDNRTADVKVSTYIDAAARSADKKPVGEFHYRYTDTDFDTLFDDTNMNPLDKNPTKNVYDELKGRPEWSGSADV